MIVDEVLADPQTMIHVAYAASFYVPHHDELSGHQCAGSAVLLFDGDYGVARLIEAAFGLPSSTFLSISASSDLIRLGASGGAADSEDSPSRFA